MRRVEALQGWIAFGGIDEGRHQPRERLLVEQRFDAAHELEQVRTQVACRRERQGS